MAIQPILEKIQRWLNETYKDRDGYNQIAVTGEPGWDTTNAMLIAYQIENGVSVDVINKETSSGEYNFTDEGFTSLSSGTDFSNQANLNQLYILQGAFYVKGISPGGFEVPYNSIFSSAVEELQSNAGIAGTGIVDLLVAKALLSMDDFVVLTNYGGVEEIAEIQKALNAKFAQEMNQLIPADGVYGRELNKALIFAFQRTEGLSVVDTLEADGYFGPGTQEKAPTITKGNENYFVTILQYALYCNGYTNISFTGIYDLETVQAIMSFGREMGIQTNSGEEVNLDVWMALLISSGNPKQKVTGCDAAQRLSLEDAQILKAKGYEIVGRYLTGTFATSVEELTNILTGGLNLFPIYETGSYERSYFNAAQGASDAVSAVSKCRSLGIPEGTTIYFTVDYDMQGEEITNLVIPYFKEIYTIFNNAQFNYNIGVYGSRNVCSQVINSDYAILAFVDGASTGYSGNMGFKMPTQWAFNQNKEGVSIEGIQIDNDQVSGRDHGFSQIKLADGTIISNNSKTKIVNNYVNPTPLAEKIINKIANSVLNIKTKPLGNLQHSGKRHWLAKDLVYIRVDEGIKGQLLNGSAITLYRAKDNSVDIISSGVGINITMLTEDSETALKDIYNSIMSSLKTTIPVETLGPDFHKLLSIELYPKFPGEILEPIGENKAGALPEYYELGAEISIELTYDLLIRFAKYFNIEMTKHDLASLAGFYCYLDLVVGFNSNEWDWYKYIIKKIVEAAFIIILGKNIKALQSQDISYDGDDDELNPTNIEGKEFLEGYSSPTSLSNYINDEHIVDAF